jgi:uncharacterized protein YjbI with pentapeptide repeats
MIRIECETGEAIDFPGDTLSGATLRGAELHRALFVDLDVSNCDFTDANLRSAAFVRSVGTGATFVRARLMAAFMNDARLDKANFREANVSAADFRQSDLRQSDLTDADAGFANFFGCDLRGAIFVVRRIEDAFLRGAVADAVTKWPPGFDPTKAGVVFTT